MTTYASPKGRLLRIEYRTKSTDIKLFEECTRSISDAEINRRSLALAAKYTLDLADISITIMQAEATDEEGLVEYCGLCGSEIVGVLMTSCTNRECKRFRAFAFERCLKCGEQRIYCAC